MAVEEGKEEQAGRDKERKGREYDNRGRHTAVPRISGKKLAFALVLCLQQQFDPIVARKFGIQEWQKGSSPLWVRWFAYDNLGLTCGRELDGLNLSSGVRGILLLRGR